MKTTDDKAIRSALVERKAEPVAWVIPGYDNARADGFIDAMAWQEGEFTRPLYAALSASPSPVDSRDDLIERPVTPHSYAQEYEFRGDGGDYVPTDGERTMIEDAICGYLGELAEAHLALTEAKEQQP